MLRTLIALAALTGASTAAHAQAQAPDGSKAFGIEPYFGIMGGYHSFDRRGDFAVPFNADRFDGALVGGVVGVNIPLGPLVVGAEGNAAKGFSDIDWEYGARGRLGFRAGESGLIFVSGGYQWIKGQNNRGFGDRDNWIYGVGAEVGPREIGLGGVTGQAGPRLRFQVETVDFNSVRGMGGVIFHF